MVSTMHIIKFADSHPLTWATPEFLLCVGAKPRAYGQKEFDTALLKI